MAGEGTGAHTLRQPTAALSEAAAAAAAARGGGGTQHCTSHQSSTSPLFIHFSPLHYIQHSTLPSHYPSVNPYIHLCPSSRSQHPASLFIRHFLGPQWLPKMLQ